MRHLLLSEQWFPQIGGSIHLFDEIYCKRIAPLERVHVVAGGRAGGSDADARYPRPVTRYDAGRYLWLRPESLVAYARMLAATVHVAKREQIDVIHCARVIPEGLVAMAVRRALGIPYTVWVHGEEVSMYSRYWGKRALMPNVFLQARAVLCNSSFSRAQAHAAGAQTDRLHVVNPCVDADRFAGPFDVGDLRVRYKLEGKTVLLSVGRLTRRKGHDHVLRALAELGRRDVAYIVVSDGELGPELRALALQLGLGDIVHFVGSVSAAELPRYYALSDIFVMANRVLPDGDVEGFGLVFLEASASGIPVVGGRSGGVVDAVEQDVSGVLVDASSVEKLASCLSALMSDRSARARLGEQGRDLVRRKFSWDVAAERVRRIAHHAPR